MSKYYLAIDMGASSGRHMLCSMQDGKMILEEVYRFENGMKEVNGHKCWDSEGLFASILAGLKKCKELGKIPSYMGIDTWGVDYVLVDADGNKVGDAVGYRDGRTAPAMAEIYENIISEKDIYGRTGIAKQVFNTVYQIYANNKENPEQIEKAENLLMTPDYYNFLLTGKRECEYTIASTSQLLSPETKDWDYELLDMLGVPGRLFKSVKEPGTVLGGFKDEIREEVGFDCQVVMVASHDTASAVLSVPSKSDKFSYISSGTWSLQGVELKEAICNELSRKNNFTNEGAYGFKYRFLKNIMGLWMIQSVRHELNDGYSFAELCSMAEEVKTFPSRVDVNDESFFAPDSMIKAIQDYCEKSGQEIPKTPGEISTVVYQSLAECYAREIANIEEMTGEVYDSINIIGGGSNAAYLNQLTANKSGKTVYAGPGEATAIGNIACQMIAAGDFAGVKEARECIFDSFEVKTYTPEI